MTLQTSNKALDETRQYIDTTISVVKDTYQDNTTLQPHRIQDPSPHPSPNVELERSPTERVKWIPVTDGNR